MGMPKMPYTITYGHLRPVIATESPISERCRRFERGQNAL
jgi:hypothetical protein